MLAAQPLAARQRKGLTQKQIGDALGVTSSRIAEWECGSDSPRSDELPSLSDVLEAPLDQLMDKQGRSRRWLEENRAALADANAFLDRHGLWSDGKRLFSHLSR
jgi:transcriptional regulator with XRE-family HTH domain